MKSSFFFQPVFILSILFSANNFLQAQMFEVPLESKIREAGLIVEGKIVESTPYLGYDGEIYTSNKLEVYQLFKQTNYEKKFLTITTRGGTFEGKSVYWTHLLSLNVGDKGLFFLIPSKRPQGFGEQPFDVYSGQQGFIKYSQTNKGTIAIDPYNKYEDPEQEIFLKIKDRIGETPKPVKDVSELRQVDEGDCIEYLFELSESDLSPFQVGADIQAKVNNGTFLLYQSLISFEYDTLIYGSSVISIGNLQLVDGAVSSSTSYDLVANDISPNKVEISLAPTGNLTNLYTLTQQYSHLATVYLNIQSPVGDPALSFDEQTMVQGSRYYDTALQEDKPFDCIDITYSSVANPVLTDFFPKTVAAGVRDNSLNTPSCPGKITIVGSGFRTLGVDFDTSELTKDYRVEFKWADKGPNVNGWVSPGVINDYGLWKDDTIIVYVPSVGQSGDNGVIELDNYCGTGGIRIFAGREGLLNLARKVESHPDSILNVRFAVRNSYTEGLPVKPPFQSIRGKLIAYHEGGVPFYFNSDFPNGYKPDVRWAISEWRCKTGVNFDIYDEADIPQNIRDLFACEIKTNPSLPTGTTSTGALVSFQGSFLNCFSQSTQEVVHSRHIFKRLEVNPNNNWHTGSSTSTLFANEHDLRSALLHEIGHAHFILHSLNEEDLMYYNPEEGSNSKYFRVITDDACKAGEHMMNFSTQSVVTANCLNSPVMQKVTQQDCRIDGTNTVFESLNNLSVSIYPSPTKDYISLELNTPAIEDMTVTVFNSIGQNVRTISFPRNTSTLKINLADLSQGVYHIAVEVEGTRIFSSKTIKL